MFKINPISLTYPVGSASVACVSVVILVWSVVGGASVAGGGAGLSVPVGGSELSDGEDRAGRDR